MAFSSALTSVTVMGNKRVIYGTYTNASGDTGGAIVTGLLHVDNFESTCTSHVGAPMPEVVSNSLGTVTILTGDSNCGTWKAEGV
jgi:hypothetical protein